MDTRTDDRGPVAPTRTRPATQAARALADALVRGPTSAAGEAVETAVLRIVAVLRVVLVVHAIVYNYLRSEVVAHPTALLLVQGAMVAWTAVTVLWYAGPRRRSATFLVLDLAVALAAILVSPLVVGPTLNGTVPSYWVFAALVVWAGVWRAAGGAIAAVAIVGANVLAYDVLSSCTVGNLFLLTIGGPIIGLLVGSLEDSAEARDRAERLAAAEQERQRLARAVHDGVLQVLGLVQRRGLEIGGETAELAQLAGQQEVALRALVQRQAVAAPPDGEIDLAEALAPLAALTSPHVTLSLPGGPVPYAAGPAAELLAIVEACLSNVRHHVGPDAPAWVLLEDLGDRVVVSVRDEGPGIAPDRLAEAEGQGRMGVSASILGRADELGAVVRLHSAPGQGTEWEVELPRTVSP